MEPWKFDEPQQDPRMLTVQEYVTRNLQSTKAGLNAARMLDLYEYLKTREFSSPEEIRKSVLQDDLPMFSEEEARRVFDQLKMRGGGPSVEFFDGMARRLGEYTGDLIPSSLKGYVYFLKGLEQTPEQGALYSTALDIATQALPTFATTIQTTAPQLIGALPIPSAAVAGVVIGWLMSAVILFLVIVMNVSRKKFGSAFVTSMALIPVVGSAALNAAKSLERVMAKVSDRRQKLVTAVSSIFGPGIGETVGSFLPNLDEPLEDVQDEIIPPVLPGFSIPTTQSLMTSIPGAQSIASNIQGAQALTSSIPGAQALASKIPTSQALASKIPTAQTLTSKIRTGRGRNKLTQKKYGKGQLWVKTRRSRKLFGSGSSSMTEPESFKRS